MRLARGPADLPADDAELLAAVADGRHAALELLYERHAPWLTLRLQRRCRDMDVVDEAVQDTFLAVWRGAHRYRGQGEVAAWIWGIGARRLIDVLRRHKTTLRQAPEGHDPEPSAEDTALDGVDHGTVGAAMARLPSDLRAVLRATVIDGLSTREAARLLGIPQGTVKTRAMRARAMMRQELS